MNPWLSMLLGFVGGFLTGSLVFLGVSMLMTYTSAMINSDQIDDEIERREKEKQENEKRTENN